jgi:hypothetical protein
MFLTKVDDCGDDAAHGAVLTAVGAEIQYATVPPAEAAHFVFAERFSRRARP